MQVRFNPEDEAPPETYRLIYRSQRVQEPNSPELSDMILNILEHGRGHNRQAGISGVLLFDTRSFAQVIEGPPKAVKSLFGHIACDPRHTAIVLQEHGLVPARAFTKWVMAFVTPLSQLDASIPSDILAGGGRDAKSILQMLISLLRDQFPAHRESAPG
ncbi:BLUF domain-containing protein [Microvirga solisilvae]|uniref:BLUF domain-containing protein n=1 Tax=Microvirga solisilvae TaxID=2919498 RepID=UPI0024344C7D|nr:BLUF domain-containing protein [Microvirga solisilvae]